MIWIASLVSHSPMRVQPRAGRIGCALEALHRRTEDPQLGLGVAVERREQEVQVEREVDLIVVMRDRRPRRAHRAVDVDAVAEDRQRGEADHARRSVAHVLEVGAADDSDGRHGPKRGRLDHREVGERAGEQLLRLNATAAIDVELDNGNPRRSRHRRVTGAGPCRPDAMSGQ